MEAGRTAARLGHDVVMFEKKNTVGGALNLWASLPGRDVMARVVDWYRGELEDLNVAVRLGVEATPEKVLAERPDAVLVATGARYIRSGESGFMPAPIPGWDRDFVFTPEQIIEDGARPRGRVLILEEERTHTGVGIAEILADGGAQVEIVTRDLQVIGENLVLSGDFIFIIPKLLEHRVRFTLASYVKEIGDHSATVFHVITNIEENREVDAVVLATMRRADLTLASQLEGRVSQLFSIGDALSARHLFDATYEGHRFARLIGVEGAPRNITEALGMFEPIPADLFPRGAATLLEAVGV
jgi:NADPH-dependent 2,4-dienoyl-CoA reductase/sulfur reductase-like enzyme